MPFLAITSFLIGLMPINQAPVDPNVFIPESSVALPLPHEIYNHTNFEIYTGAPNIFYDSLSPRQAAGPAEMLLSASVYYTPAQIQQAYGNPGTGGSGVIAIVDAYDYPTALADFNQFSSYYGLPTEPSTNVTASTNAVFQVVYASGSKPSSNSGWNQEEALDIEWAHAMAPKAKIVLVEATNNAGPLYTAVQVAAGLPGVREISMSWGGGESSGEISEDSTYFNQRSVVYFAATGDTGSERNYPALSPNVVACGGTSLYLNADNSYSSESVWGSGGGGPSVYEPIPSYQFGAGLTTFTGGKRGSPDISAVADPNTGVVVDWKGALYVFGGTSVATPLLAGLHNASTAFHRSSEFNYLYFNQSFFHDITTGSNGFSAGTGYDFGTGIGTPISPNSL